MTHEQAVALLRAGVPDARGIWADIGAGAGTFAHALSEMIGPSGQVTAVDRDGRSLGHIRSDSLGAPIRTLQADFRRPLALPKLDGLLLANALHFVARQESVLRNLLTYLNPGGRALFFEYDTRQVSPWNPYPLSEERLRRLTESVGLEGFRECARMSSSFGQRELYLALALKPA